MQRTAAYFLSLGHYDAQIRRMSKSLHSRRRTIENAIDQSDLTIAGRGVYGGSSLWMQAPEHVDTAQLALQLQEKSVVIEPGAPFFEATNRPHHYYRLGYSSIPEARIEPGINQIAKSISELWT